LQADGGEISMIESRRQSNRVYGVCVIIILVFAGAGMFNNHTQQAIRPESTQNAIASPAPAPMGQPLADGSTQQTFRDIGHSLRQGYAWTVNGPLKGLFNVASGDATSGVQGKKVFLQDYHGGNLQVEPNPSNNPQQSNPLVDAEQTWDSIKPPLSLRLRNPNEETRPEQAQRPAVESSSAEPANSSGQAPSAEPPKLIQPLTNWRAD
jgi:hypothetical protein